MPATYSQISQRTGVTSTKRVRNLVAGLCELYTLAIPQLQERMERRQQTEAEELGLPAEDLAESKRWHAALSRGGCHGRASQGAEHKSLGP